MLSCDDDKIISSAQLYEIELGAYEESQDRNHRGGSNALAHVASSKVSEGQFDSNGTCCCFPKHLQTLTLPIVDGGQH